MLILASASPRRRTILQLAGLGHEVDPSGVDETVETDDPVIEATEVALRKASAVAARRPGATVLGADTTTAVDGDSFGKPADRDDARRMLHRLSGRSCLITSGVALVEPGRQAAGAVSAVVHLRELTDDEIDAYVGTGAADDKAAGLELQDRAADFVASTEGCPGAIIGLPLCALRDQLGLDVPECTHDRCLAGYGRLGG
ncbi:MAG: nucleoside triphosphate pyrophosphatase [Actinomycetota bacterium]